MSYRETVEGMWRRNVLFSALVELTYRCNLDCFFCYNDLSLDGRPMRLADYERFFTELAELGCLHLTLTGGEPLAHPDFFAIGGAGRRLGFLVRVKSNGHALRGALLSRLLEEVDPFVVEVSLHGARAETHDRQTRVAGSFSRLVANVKEMKAAGLRVKINATLTRWNENEIEEMFALADDLGFPLRVDPEVTPRDDDDLTPLTLTATPSALKRLFALPRSQAPDVVAREGDEQARTVSPDRHCGAGSSAIAVDPFGNVYPCVQWRRPAGNLHERSIREIWWGSETLVEVRRITVEAKKVAGGLASFCPGVAEKRTGDPLRVPQLLRAELPRLDGSSSTPLPIHPGTR